MVELVDTYALGAYAFERAGSNPVPGTKTAKNSGSSRLDAFFVCYNSGKGGLWSL